MKKNVGSTDQLVRYAAGAVLIGLGLYYGSWWGVIGIVPIATALIGWCPPYSILGINTRSAKDKPA